MYERLNCSTKSAVAYRITRPLSQEEIKKIIAELEGTIVSGGKLRVLIDLQSFPYEDLQVFWEDFKFDVKHARDFERMALVGGNELEKWSTRLFAALTWTRCRCFPAGRVDEAWEWLVAE